MKTIFRFLLLVLFAGALQCAVAAPGDESFYYGQEPVAEKSQPVRIALVASGDFSVYQRVIGSMAKGLSKLQLISNGQIPAMADHELLAPVWQWLAKNAGGDKIQFLADGVYNLEWDPDSKVLDSLYERLKTKKDIDIIFAVGSHVSRMIAKNITDVPLICYVSTNAASSGLVKSAEDSGQHNLHVMVEPNRFVRQMQIFHEILGFKRLGFIYTLDQANQYENDQLRPACSELGVELFPCSFAKNSDDRDKMLDHTMACARHLKEEDGVDALAISFFEYPEDRKNELADYLIAQGVPSFSVSKSPDFVKNGLLMGLDSSNLDEVGLFEANVIRRILSGLKPREIGQIYTPQRTLFINLTTAMQLGWVIPFDLFSSIGSVHTFTDRAASQRSKP